jgi:hypothetical protein
VRAAEDAWLDVALVPGESFGCEILVSGSGIPSRIGIVVASEQSSELLLDPLKDAALGIAAAAPGIVSGGSAPHLVTSAHFVCSI